MPRLRDLKPYRGALPVALSQGGGTYLLFFWATWCGPCKASLPEVVAFEQESGVPVIAITDEPVAQLDAFFTQYHEAFPAIVAVDEFRKAFLAYGVHGTPTFVLADGAGKVQSFSSGYRAETGLPFAGWSWTKR
jgi:thiol-disulfide isomerase/thioredoxin